MRSNILKVLVGVMLVSIFAAGNLAAQLSGGPHDLRGLYTGANTYLDQDLCRFCHTPHNAQDPSSGVVQLWDRLGPDTATFSQYDSGTLHADNKNQQPAGVSAACLSCHDGATAFDAIQGLAQTDANNMDNAVLTNPAANLGTSLANDHPVSVAMDPNGTVLGDLRDPTGITTLTFYSTAVTGASYGVECASCHDPHGDDGDYFLRIPSATGGLCETCHNK
jgi:predicted CXXCH cytochrome family protein